MWCWHFFHEPFRMSRIGCAQHLLSLFDYCFCFAIMESLWRQQADACIMMFLVTPEVTQSQYKEKALTKYLESACFYWLTARTRTTDMVVNSNVISFIYQVHQVTLIFSRIFDCRYYSPYSWKTVLPGDSPTLSMPLFSAYRIYGGRILT